MSPIFRRQRARADIEEQARYIADDNPDAARRFLDAVERSLELLHDMPELGVRRPIRNPALKDLRLHPVRGFEKHLIFYRPIEDGIELIRVLHAARDTKAILAAEPDPGWEGE